MAKLLVIIASVAFVSARPESLSNSLQQEGGCSAVSPTIPATPSVGKVTELLVRNGITTMVDFLEKAGLYEVLSGPGPITVFAPMNSAFSSMDAAILRSIQNDTALLKAVLSYHIVAIPLPPSAIKNELILKSLAGARLRVNIYGPDDVTINGALAMEMIEVGDGSIIYVIDKVLVPDTVECDIVQVLQKKGNFSTFLSALELAGLTSTLKSEGPFTLFAPHDSAFQALSSDTLLSIFAKPDELESVLLAHILSGTFYNRWIPHKGGIPVAGGGEIEVEVSYYKAAIGNAHVIDGDQFASNGVVHVVDAVIIPSKDAIIIDEVIVNPSMINETTLNETEMIEGVLRHNGLNILADLLVKTNLTKLLTKLDRFTLLAPNDDAFNLAANSTDINVIKHTLNYHIVESALPLSAVVNMTTKSITGDRLRFNIYRNNMTVNGALVLKTFEISKGVIYVIDKLLVPETAGQNIVELLEKKGGFTTFLTALNVSRLANHFETNGPFTLFAPTDEAFKSLSSHLLIRMATDSKELKKLLLSHALPGTLYNRGLVSGKINLARGGSVPVIVDLNGVKVSEADVIETDLTASNGVVHVVNHVI